jgi:hypothetical protein
LVLVNRPPAKAELAVNNKIPANNDFFFIKYFFWF